MQEAHSESPLLTKDGVVPQKGEVRRVVEEPCDLSQIIQTDAEVRRRIKEAGRVLLKYRLRRLSTQTAD
jgi:hypothetical protein